MENSKTLIKNFLNNDVITNENFHWYIIIVKRGREQTVIKEIYNKLSYFNLLSQISEMKVKQIDDKVLNGFIFIKAEMDETLLKIMYKITDLMSFLNHEFKSNKLPDFIDIKNINYLFEPEKNSSDYELFNLEDEKENHLNNKNKNFENKKNDSKKIEEEKTLMVGKRVKIINGMFINYEGEIVQINTKKSNVNVVLDYDGINQLMTNINLEKIPVEYCENIN